MSVVHRKINQLGALLVETSSNSAAAALLICELLDVEPTDFESLSLALRDNDQDQVKAILKKVGEEE